MSHAPSGTVPSLDTRIDSPRSRRLSLATGLVHLAVILLKKNNSFSAIYQFLAPARDIEAPAQGKLGF